MPGVPRSRGCEQCKKRKIKCDENWPVCHNCTRRRLSCGGPTTLVKFIVNGDHVGSQRSSRRTGTSSKGDGTMRLLNMESLPRVPYQSTLHGGSSGSLMCFRLPSPSPSNTGPTTAADRVAARLVYQLESPGEEQLITRTKVLAHIPKRISTNESLRDSIDLLCSVWTSYRAGDELAEFVGMPLYGKAIRSLSRTLNSKQAFSVETLASIAILQRAEDLFDPGQSRMLHEKGIATLLPNIDPPKSEDPFQTSVFTEVYGMMLPYWMATGWNSVIDQPKWREAIVSGLADSVGVQALKPLFDSIFVETNRICAEIPVLLQGFASLIDPKAPKYPATSSFVTKMTKGFCDAENSLEEAVAAIFDKALELGEVTEEDCITPITQTRYTFSSTHLCLTIISFVTFHLFLLRLRYQVSASYELPDASSLYESYEDACVNIWKFIPFLKGSTVFISAHLQGALALSYGVADENQREYLLTIFEGLENYGQKTPRTREQLRSELNSRNTSLRISFRGRASKEAVDQERPAEGMSK
ncbi:unnamed protein product [Clonostachys rosea]|uniref:Zn(2)-C6 fungal-type domain-containing protein n=1 Tax=Bionectria ochroleuca TaxID=29856 RepID=A0ABY6U552_BIOOC|nr:unnamed protein product [Clonostachys rosea]